MKQATNTFGRIAAVGLGLLSAGCVAIAEQEFQEVEQVSAPLLGDPGFGYWGSRDDAMPVLIPVCFENPSSANAAFRTLVRDAVEKSWQRYSRLRFTGWSACSQSFVEGGIHILLADSSASGFDGRVVPFFGSDGGVHVGKHALDGRRAALNPPAGMWLNPNLTGDFARYVAVHEFGHAIGFYHEENRDDTPGACDPQGVPSSSSQKLGNFDTDSVMSYCGSNRNGRLSANDIASVQRIYGRKILGQIVTPRGNCLEGFPWLTGGTGNKPWIAPCDDHQNQLWKWKWSGSAISFSQFMNSDATREAAITMVSSTNGTPIEQRVFSASGSAQWTFTNAEIRGFGAKCLTFPGTVGAELKMRDCSSRALPPTRNGNQRWDRVDPNGILRLHGTNTCVAVPNPSSALSGQRLITRTCNTSSPAQQFAFGANHSQMSSIHYRASNGFCFEVIGPTDAQFTTGFSGPSENASIRLRACSSTPLLTQSWNLTGQVKALGKCIDRPGGDETLLVATTRTWSCTSAANGDFVTNSSGQEWDFYWK